MVHEESNRGGAARSRSVIEAPPHLDAEAAARIETEVQAAVSAGAERVDVDLRNVQHYDEAGTEALRTCRTISTPQQCALHFLTAPGAGREALFVAFSEVDVETETLID